MKRSQKRNRSMFLFLFLFFSTSTLAELKPGAALDAVQISKFGKTISPLKVEGVFNAMDNGLRSRGRFVSFRTSEELSSNYEISISNNKLQYRGEVLDTSDTNEFMYIVENDGKMYGAAVPKGNFINGNGVFHTSLVNEEWPIFSGTMKVQNGKVTRLTNISGHFKPEGERIDIFAEYLQREKVVSTRVFNKFKTKYVTSSEEVFRSEAESYQDVVQGCM
ncbi:hypothetical protein IX95_15045 [Vibrio sp. B183]|uniref:hypothetical protein n=1 Tax=Vibrio sp. B183 TaxID=1526762 RepID=UPI0005087834|nr:hypothetical protein IX95_15045 [Vibrio sp. B183]